MTQQQACFVVVAGIIGFGVAWGVAVPTNLSGSWLVGCIASFGFSTIIWE